MYLSSDVLSGDFPAEDSGASGYWGDFPPQDVWSVAKRAGLRDSEYGITWFVYTSRAEYLASLD